MIKQPDGKILIAGSFTSIRGVPRYSIARLLPNAEVDRSFDAGIILGDCNAMALQADGRVVIGGDFYAVNGTARLGIARLTSEGVLDDSFSQGARATTSAGKPGAVKALWVQPDGAILVGGLFDNLNGVNRSRIGRLLPGGALDEGFNPGGGITGGSRRVNSIAVQADGKILVGGTFSRFNNVARRNLVRLNSDGSIDPEFDPLDQLWSEAYSVTTQDDGNIVVAGNNYCRRLESNGKTLDPEFVEPDFGIGAEAAEVRTVEAIDNGGYIVGGKFYRVGNRWHLSAAAFVEESFVVAGGAMFVAQDLNPNRVDLLKFTNYTALGAVALESIAFGNGTLVGVSSAGSLLRSADFASWDVAEPGSSDVFHGVVFANNSFLAVGDRGVTSLSTDNGTTWQGAVMIPADTDLYAACHTGAGWMAVGGADGSGVVWRSDDGLRWTDESAGETNVLYGVSAGNGMTIAVGENGAILVSHNGSSWSRVVASYTNTLHAIAFGNNAFVAVGAAGRILCSTDGSTWVNAYNGSPQSPLQPLYSVVHGHGKFLTVGSYGTVLASDPSVAPPNLYFLDRTLADRFMNNVVRLDERGMVRADFVSGIEDLLSVYAESVNAAVAEGDRVLMAGQFVRVGGTNAGDVARLNLDGTLDPEFAIGMGVGGPSSPQAIATQPDGRILLGGDFTSVNGVPRNRIARIHPDGRLDETFHPGEGADRGVYSIALDPMDGRAVIGGMFTGVDRRSRRPVARLNTDGSLDTTFDPGIGPAFNDTVSALVVQPDHKVLLNGSNARILRLENDGRPDAAFVSSVGVGLSGGTVRSIALDSDGTIVLGGTFTNSNGVKASRLARLLPSGANDSDFLTAIGAGADGAVNSVSIQEIAGSPGRWILCAGAFTSFNGIPSSRIARLNGNGNVDATFSVNVALHTNVNFIVSARGPSSGEDFVFIAGSFTNVNGVARARLARLHSDGSLDTAFNAGSGPDADPTALVVEGVGTALLGGSFRVVDGERWPGLARMRAGEAADSWWATYFNADELTDPNVGGNGADPDHDGIVNLVEYALNLDPRNPDASGLPEVRIEVNPDDGKPYAVLSFRRRAGGSGLDYVLGVSGDFIHWDTAPGRFQVIGIVSVGEGETEIVSVRVIPSMRDASVAFVRLQIR